MKATKTLLVQNYQTQEEIKHCLAITLFLKMLQDFMAAAYTCRPQITQKEYAGGRDMPKHLIRCETFENLSFIQGF